jgi:hypothetical protein
MSGSEAGEDPFRWNRLLRRKTASSWRFGDTAPSDSIEAIQADCFFR